MLDRQLSMVSVMDALDARELSIEGTYAQLCERLSKYKKRHGDTIKTKRPRRNRSNRPLFDGKTRELWYKQKASNSGMFTG